MKNIYKYCFMLLFIMTMTTMGYAQRNVTGVIMDSDTNEPLIGATVQAVGTTTGTITDIDGKFSLNVPTDATSLEVSYTGYATQLVDITSDNLNIMMTAGTQLDEVVVVGYGTMKSKEVTSSIVSIKADEFIVGNVASPAQLLQGKVAGLTITRNGGDPNGQVGIRLRGLSTIGAQTEPLVIVDGVPGASLSNIDPRDIANIDVLKDGSAAAIYGTRGSSGVILVTTKKGEPGSSRITYGGNISAENITRVPDIATAEEFRAAGGNDAGATTDWYDEISQQGLAHAHNLSLSGGTDQTSYRVSFNYRDQDGVVKNTGFDQINGSLSIRQKALNDRMTVGLNMIATNRKSNIGFREAFRYATIFNPTSPVFNDDGSYNHPSGFDVFNPVSMVEENTALQETDELLANITVAYEIVDGLKITGSYAKQRKDIFTNEYYTSSATYRAGPGVAGALKSTENQSNDLFEGILSYDGTANNLDYNILVGTSYQRFDQAGFGAYATGFLNDDNSFNQISQASDFRTGNANLGSFGNFYRLQAQFARGSVNIDDTYFFSASVRREGSDRFGEANRYGIFPAVSAGVDISRLANIGNVDNLKLRVGYGVTGNLPGQNYLFQSIFVQGPQFFFNGSYVPSFGPQTNANPDLRWETKTEINLGLDFSLFDYRLTGALDVFNRQTDDLILLVNVPVPPNLAPQTWQNSAAFSTNGIELALNYKLIDNDNFSYTPGLIVTSYKTILDKYLEDSPSFFITNLGAPGQNITDAGVGLHYLEEGQEIGQLVAPVIDNVDAEGAINFVDQNGDGEINADDWIVHGSGLPDFELSLNNNFKFGTNWDMNIFLRAAIGHSLVNTYRAFYEIFPDNPGANFINTELANTAVKTASYNSEHIERADFLKLDNMSIGYTFNTEDSKIGGLRMYLAGQNLFTITNYTGVDPEVRLGDTGSVDNGGRESDTINVLAPGVDRRNSYFFTRILTLGADVTF